jgi:hypothetical protein
MGIFWSCQHNSQSDWFATAQNPNQHQFKQGFQQLGQDLQSGNLSQAQSDFSSLQHLPPSGQQSERSGVAHRGGVVESINAALMRNVS